MGDLAKLRIETTCLVAVENAECLWHFEKALRHFPDLRGLDYALVLRWHWRTAWRQWLNSWKGQMLYFPDYDPAGFKIFATEVLPNRPSARLMVPENFEALLEKHGNRDLYLKQEKYLPELMRHDNLADLCQKLQKSRKAIEQESLLSEDRR
jgi:hypothetical protein